MKTQELTDYLSGLIINKSDTVLTDGLYRGKMGLALYFNFYAKVKNTGSGYVNWEDHLLRMGL